MEYAMERLTVTMKFGDWESTVYPTLLRDEKEIILVDCAFVDALPLLEKELGRHRVSVRELTGLVLTHHDHDHMGTAAAIRRLNPNMRIYASAAEVPSLSAWEKPLRLRQAEERQKTLPPEQQAFGEAFCRMLRRVEPVAVDRTLADGMWLDWCGGCRVYATPGHTPGHLSLWMEKERIVITGDAIALENGAPCIANPEFTLDLEQAKASMERLLALQARAYYCYHGGIYEPETRGRGAPPDEGA